MPRNKTRGTSGFVFAPVPSNNMIEGGSYNQASASGVGTVEKYLVIDSACMCHGGIRYVNKPAPCKSALHSGMAYIVAFSQCS